MLTFNGVPVGAKRCQFQRVIQHLGHLRQLETGKPSVMGIAEAWRQDQTKGLTNQGSFRPAVDGLETVIDFLNDPRGIGTNKGRSSFSRSARIRSSVQAPGVDIAKNSQFQCRDKISERSFDALSGMRF